MDYAPGARTIRISVTMCLHGARVLLVLCEAKHNRFASFRQHTSSQKRRKWAKDELEQAVDTLSPISSFDSAANPHVVNYNYAILISKHARHESQFVARSQSRSRARVRVRVRVQLEVLDNLSLTNCGGCWCWRWKGAKWWMKYDDFQWQQATPVGRETRQVPVQNEPSSWSHLTPATRTLWALIEHIRWDYCGGWMGCFAVIYTHKSVCFSGSLRPANRKILAFMILIEADVYWQLNNSPKQSSQGAELLPQQATDMNLNMFTHTNKNTNTSTHMPHRDNHLNWRKINMGVLVWVAASRRGREQNFICVDFYVY